ncbi:symmetrical bis(5'-nucleosyl)-tetraphosphatase [Motiliproteus sp. MSK22-1]|uniref:symmetrical bis(5'-nucleosyl)-tetraphosphatase n=1 Tax=Motiliproteus sp. MSK22-1 TaxID=1897630 RepID=UPI000978B466|nr:symmetrical bis(5'-nucleosyl)-tetraphosphatase [Motiliproteus sp. MSK22-1]OMH32154.1 bis(5'-nucleosyl)-tetraphosphatase (symmetrical) [Motiliproteus sp. MSK22-1]
MATYAVGDVQGCLDELLSLLELVSFTEDDQLWLTGDLVNRGPASLETLRFAKGLGRQIRVVLGNHDLHLLAIANGSAKPSRKDTLDEILSAPDREPLLDWLRQQPLLHHDSKLKFTMVHAGIPPIWTLKQAKSYSREVEEVLRSDDAGLYFDQMYGNQPGRWEDSLTGWDRLRCITNYFTRMRFCSAEGELEFKAKSGPDKAPDGFHPWYSFPDRKTQKKAIVFGHWASLEGKANTDNVHALDTGCVWGGTLTAMRLEDRKIFRIASVGYA